MFWKQGLTVKKGCCFLRSPQRKSGLRFFRGYNSNDYIGEQTGEYREKLVKESELYKQTKEEILNGILERQKDNAGLLAEFADMDSLYIQLILRQMNNDELVAALAGTSGEVAVRILSNVADRLIPYIAEDLMNFRGMRGEMQI